MKTFVIRALADTFLEGDESFTIRLLPAESGAVIDPLTGQYLFFFLFKKKKDLMSVVFHGYSDPVILPTSPGVATITIRADKAALGVIGVAESSRNILIGEPHGDYNGSAVVR